MKIGGIIRGWYKKNRRDLPWRQTSKPYEIWLSEIILQQTRVDQGLHYYFRFLEAFPDIHSLARASEDEVLKQWQGLGYYSRARNMHLTARQVVGQMEGQLPTTYDGLLKLKGVGDYTAAAIASICHGEPRAAVDGNVSRVIARIFGIVEPVNGPAGRALISSLASELMDRTDPGNSNQAMMEFGALQCVPANPDCDSCPLADLCEARQAGKVHLLPVKVPKRKPLECWMYFYILLCNGETILTKRGTGGIWKSLYHFPVAESESPLSEEAMMEALLRQLHIGNGHPPVKVTIGKRSESIRHQLTHRTIHARFIHLSLQSWPTPLPPGWKVISLDKVDDFPVPRLINRYMEVVKF